MGEKIALKKGKVTEATEKDTNASIEIQRESNLQECEGDELTRNYYGEFDPGSG